MTTANSNGTFISLHFTLTNQVNISDSTIMMRKILEIMYRYGTNIDDYGHSFCKLCTPFMQLFMTMLAGDTINKSYINSNL